MQFPFKWAKFIQSLEPSWGGTNDIHGIAGKPPYTLNGLNLVAQTHTDRPKSNAASEPAKTTINRTWMADEFGIFYYLHAARLVIFWHTQKTKNIFFLLALNKVGTKTIFSCWI